MATPAPDLPTLLDFETQFETACGTILTNAGITASITAARSAANVPSLDVAYRFEPGAAHNHWGTTPSGKHHYDLFDGHLEISLYANRDNDANPASDVYQQFKLLRGQIRTAMLEGAYPFSILAYLDLQSGFLRPTGTVTGVSEDKQQDVSTMGWAVRFGIIKSAWPAAS